MTPWYVALIRSPMHASVHTGLTEAKIEHYAPMERISKRHRQGWRDYDKPLIPAYVFVRTDRLDLVRAVDGVIRIVGFPDAQALSEPAVERLYAIREAEAAGVFDRRRKDSTWKPGQRVRIVDGPYKGWIGEILRYKGGRRVAVAMQGLSMWKPRSADLDVSALEAA